MAGWMHRWIEKDRHTGIHSERGNSWVQGWYALSKTLPTATAIAIACSTAIPSKPNQLHVMQTASAVQSHKSDKIQIAVAHIPCTNNWLEFPISIYTPNLSTLPPYTSIPSLYSHSPTLPLPLPPPPYTPTPTPNLNFHSESILTPNIYSHSHPIPPLPTCLVFTLPTNPLSP